MRLTQILKPECVKVPLEATTKEEAIYELVDLLAAQKLIQNPSELKKAIWQRETTRTTGIGHGIAIPHGKCEGCTQLAMAIGKPRQPLDFKAIDGRPVELILLLASPLDQTGPHIQALASISRMLTDAQVRSGVKASESSEDLYGFIKAHESE